MPEMADDVGRERLRPQDADDFCEVAAAQLTDIAESRLATFVDRA